MTFDRQQQMEAVICRYIKQTPQALYDIGVGPKTEWRVLRRRWPRLEMYGCEPHPDTFRRLKKSWHGTLWPVAIAAEPGETTLHYLPSALLSAGTIARPEHNRAVTVEAWTLDQFDAKAGHQPGPIILWMDIEGSELTALRSGPELLASGRVRWINLEEARDDEATGWPPGWAKPREIRELLEGHGYRRVLEYNRHPGRDGRGHQDVIYTLEVKA